MKAKPGEVSCFTTDLLRGPGSVFLHRPLFAYGSGIVVLSKNVLWINVLMTVKCLSAMVRTDR